MRWADALEKVDGWLSRRSARYLRWWWSRHSLELERERDAEMNRESAPPPDECVSWRGVWLAEIFPLSMTPALAEQLSRIPKSSRGFGAPELDRTIAELASLAAMPRGGTWAHLGTVRKGRWGSLDLKPPPGVNSVMLWLHAPLPSVIIIVAAFEFDDSLREEPTRLLRHEWRTEHERHGPGTSVIWPMFRKEREIRTLRFTTKMRCAEWLAHSLGLRGIFSLGGLDGGRYPATEWWTTRVARPLDPSRGSAPAEYIRLAGLYRPFDLWQSDRFVGHRLTEADSDDDDQSRRAPSHALMFAGRESDLFAGVDIQMYGGNTPEGWLNRIAIDLSALTALWAFHGLLRVYERETVSIREGFLTLEPRRVRRSLKSLQRLEGQFVRTSGDLVPLLHDLAESAAQLERATKFYSGVDFESCDPQQSSSALASRAEAEADGDGTEDATEMSAEREIDGKEEVAVEPEESSTGDAEERGGLPRARDTWVPLVARSVVERAERLRGRSETIRDLYEGMSMSLNTRSNLRLQAAILWLTAMLVILGVAALVVTIWAAGQAGAD